MTPKPGEIKLARAFVIPFIYLPPRAANIGGETDGGLQKSLFKIIAFTFPNNCSVSLIKTFRQESTEQSKRVGHDFFKTVVFSGVSSCVLM